MKQQIIKHAKRAHTHVQDHGHKWLWFLTAVFIVILIYPYFSHADEPVCPEGEVVCNGGCVNEFLACEPPCTNGGYAPNCNACPEGQELNEDEECVGMIDPIVCDDEEANNFEAQGECTYDQADPEVISLTGTVTYNPATSTTGSVTATITGFSTTGVTITNNSGNTTYVFTGNGTFTFTFENEQGTTGEETATVDWIEEVVTPLCTVNLNSPTSGAIIGGVFPITWTKTQTCIGSTPITIQLRDHNNQWINIGTGVLSQTGIQFASTGLASTGLYTITGTHLSGSNRTVENDSGVVVESGVYTQDTPYTIYTGAYSGVYTNVATGYAIRIIDETATVLTTLENITIDNQKPTLTALTGSFAPVVSGKVGKPGIMTASFTASEQLTGGTTFTILGTNVTPSSGSQSGNIYTYTMPLESVVTSGALAFTAHITDLAGNTGAAYATSTIILNNHTPVISGFALTGTVASGVKLSWNTDTSTKHNFSYYRSGTATTTYFTGTTYTTAHNYTMTNIQNNNQYPFTLTVSDNLGNTRIGSGVVHVSTTGVITANFSQYTNTIQLSAQAETNLYLQILQNEVNKFRTCKDVITFTDLPIKIGNKTITIHMPRIDKSNTEKLMGAFLLIFAKKIEIRTDLSQSELNAIAETVNNFLIILKLTGEDTQVCEQNMSNYYISIFKQMMEQMKFF